MNERGLSFVELLLALLFFSTIGLAAFSTFRTFAAFELRLGRKVALSRQLERSRQLFDSAYGESSSLYLGKRVVIHPTGRIADNNGTLHRVLFGPAERRPKTNSNALSFLNLESEGMLYPSAGQTLGRFCRSSDKLSPLAFDEWFAVSLDGAIEVRVELSKTQANCRGPAFIAKLHPAPFPIFYFSETGEHYSTEQIIATLRMLVPIRERYTIYLDESGRLRRLSHSTGENQPSVGYWNSLRVNEVNSPRGAILHRLSLQPDPSDRQETLALDFYTPAAKNSTDFIAWSLR